MNDAPISLYDNAQVSSSSTQDLSEDAFRNKSGVPIELHSMRVFVNIPNGDRVDAGGVVGLQISLGDEKITRGVVPLWNICKSANRVTEHDYSSVAAATYPLVYASAMAIDFAHPIVLAPNDALSVRAVHRGIIDLPANVDVAFVGKRAPTPESRIRRLPYIVHWQSRNFALDEAGVDSTPAGVLGNDLRRPLTVHRIIGRGVSYFPRTTIGLTVTDMREDGDIGDTPARLSLVRLALSQNRWILRDYAPIRTVFGVPSAIETDFILRSGDYLHVDYKKVAYTASNPPTFFQAWTSISLVGSREV